MPWDLTHFMREIRYAKWVIKTNMEGVQKSCKLALWVETSARIAQESRRYLPGQDKRHKHSGEDGTNDNRSIL